MRHFSRMLSIFVCAIAFWASGEVVVSDGVGQACRAALSSSGEAACTLTFPNAGLYHVRAAYEGNADFAADTSPPLVVFVGRAGRGP